MSLTPESFDRGKEGKGDRKCDNPGKEGKGERCVVSDVLVL